MPFLKCVFTGTGKHIVPSAVYFSPQPHTLRALIGEDALTGFQSDPVLTKSPIYSNLKTLFKSDLLRRKKDLGHSYLYHKSLGILETSPREVSREFLGNYLRGLDAFRNTPMSEAQIYLGKPAYPQESERRFTENIREIFKDLGLRKPPKMIYEPYALFYFCRFGLQKSFVRPGSQGSHVLVLDHGGGTINTCIVKTTSKGKLTKARPKGPYASQHGGSLLDQFLIIGAIRKLNLPIDCVLQILTEKNELKVLQKERLLLAVEKLKIDLFTEKSGRETVEGSIEDHNIPGVPRPWKLSFSKQDAREGFHEIWRGCHDTIAATLKAAGVSKLHYVILAGGTCRLGYHKDLLNKDFSDFIEPTTEFIDVSDYEKPVAYGLAIQAVLDSMQEKSEQFSSVEKTDENLSEYVARDLSVRIASANSNQEHFRTLADEIVVHAGDSKAKLWDEGVEKPISLSGKPKRLFCYSFVSGSPSKKRAKDDEGTLVAVQPTPPSDHGVEEDVVEGETVLVRQAYLSRLERGITLKLHVNDQGKARPQFFLAPKKSPRYFEPDRAAYTLYIPDLEARGFDQKQVQPPHANPSCVAIDFGTSTTCACGIDLDEAKASILTDKPLLSYAPRISYASVTLEADGRDYRKPIAVLKSMNIDPRLVAGSQRLFEDGHFGDAVFAAFKVVEQVVRDKAGNPRAKAGGDLYGRYLMNKVFTSENPIIIVSGESGTQDAYRDLFAGIMGIRGAKFAHDPYLTTTPWEAIVWIGLASLLLDVIPPAELG